MVRERDQRRALAFALEAGAANTTAEFAAVTVEGAPELVACDTASYNEIAEGGRSFYLVWPDDVMTAELTDSFNRLVGQHPLIQHYAHSGDGRALRITDVVRQEEFRALDLYREFFGPLGLDYQVAVTLPSPDGVVIGLALSRGGRDFEGYDCALLNVLRPHLARAHARVVELEELRLRVTALEQGADALQEGIVLLDRGRVEHVSEPARRLLEEFFGREQHGGRLPNELAERLVAAGGREVVVDRGERRLTAQPVGGAGMGVIVLGDSLRPLPGYDLTPRELEILASVADGRTDGEIGLQLRISARTVERHLQNAYAKLGVHTRAGAVARVFSPARR